LTRSCLCLPPAQSYCFSQKKGVWPIKPSSFLHKIRLYYFFAVFLVAFVAVFFVVPHAAPLDLHAITNLLHKKIISKYHSLSILSINKPHSNHFQIQVHSGGAEDTEDRTAKMFILIQREAFYLAASHRQIKKSFLCVLCGEIFILD
jgi:hypothetical protein